MIKYDKIKYKKKKKGKWKVIILIKQKLSSPWQDSIKTEIVAHSFGLRDMRIQMDYYLHCATSCALQIQDLPHFQHCRAWFALPKWTNIYMHCCDASYIQEENGLFIPQNKLFFPDDIFDLLLLCCNAWFRWKLVSIRFFTSFYIVCHLIWLPYWCL